MVEEAARVSQNAGQVVPESHSDSVTVAQKSAQSVFGLKSTPAAIKSGRTL